MSIFSNITDAFGDIFSGVGKAFESVTKLDFGEIAKVGLTAAAVYYGGQYLMQAWGASPASAAGGLAGSGAGDIAGTGIMEGLSGAENVAAAAEAGTAASAGGAGDLSWLDKTLGNAPAASNLPATTAVAPSAPASNGLIGSPSPSPVSAPASVGGYGGPINAAANPPVGAAKSWFSGLDPVAQYGLIQTGAGMVQGAFSPNALDVEKERARLDRENMEWRQKFLAPNFGVSRINMRPSAQKRLLDSSGNPVYPVQPV